MYLRKLLRNRRLALTRSARKYPGARAVSERRIIGAMGPSGGEIRQDVTRLRSEVSLPKGVKSLVTIRSASQRKIYK